MNYLGVVSTQEITYPSIAITERKKLIKYLLRKYPDIMNRWEKGDVDFL